MKSITLENQMELTLGKGAQPPRLNRKTATRRAGWWFGQMRQVVDRAIDWKPRPAAPAHQVYMSLDREKAVW